MLRGYIIEEIGREQYRWHPEDEQSRSFGTIHRWLWVPNCGLVGEQRTCMNWIPYYNHSRNPGRLCNHDVIALSLGVRPTSVLLPRTTEHC